MAEEKEYTSWRDVVALIGLIGVGLPLLLGILGLYRLIDWLIPAAEDPAASSRIITLNDL